MTVEDLTKFGKIQGSAIERKLETVDLSHVKALFATKKLAYSTTLIMAVWGFIGLGYPLYNAFIPYIQATKGAQFGDGSTYLTYRNSLIIAVLGVPGALLGGLLVEVPRIGRKGTLAASTVLTGVFLYASTTAVTSAALLGWQCAFNFFSNIMYAVLYGYTPEIFPTKDRGTGNALTATANRVFGIMAVSFHFDFPSPSPSPSAASAASSPSAASSVSSSSSPPGMIKLIVHGRLAIEYHLPSHSIAFQDFSDLPRPFTSQTQPSNRILDHPRPSQTIVHLLTILICSQLLECLPI